MKTTMKATKDSTARKLSLVDGQAPTEKWLSTRHVCRLLGVDRTSVAKMVGAGELVGRRVSRDSAGRVHWRYTESSVLRMKALLKPEPVPAPVADDGDEPAPRYAQALAEVKAAIEDLKASGARAEAEVAALRKEVTETKEAIGRIATTLDGLAALWK